MIRFFSLADPYCWILILCAPFGVGLFLYVLIQFDIEDKHRNHRNFHYIMIMIILPGITGINQRYNPNHQMLRLLTFYCSAIFVLGWVVFFFQLLRFIKVPVQFAQISTAADLVDNRFRLSGSNNVFSLITTDKMVFLFPTSISIEIIEFIHVFSMELPKSTHSPFAKASMTVRST